MANNKKGKKSKAKSRISIAQRFENFQNSESAGAMATKYLLMFLAVGTIAFGGALVPGLIKALGSLDFSGGENIGDKYTKKQINNALSNLKRRKFIKISKEKDGQFKIKLTNKGQKRVLKLSIENVAIVKPSKWDGKWRIVIFDIPSEFNPAREALRRKIKELGLKQLQKSVWVFPYDCEDEILFVAEAFEVEKYVEIITAEKVLHEKVLKDAFKI